MLRPRHQRTPPPEALARVEAWCRDRFALAEADVVMVSQIECAVPGCPPLETVVAFWTASKDESSERHHFKVFKPVTLVEPDDLPYAWQKPTLRSQTVEGCECC